MGMILAKDGKARALQINTGAAPPAITTYYVGLLATLPADYDALTLEELVSTVGAEHTPSADWYNGGRKAITFDAVPTAINGDFAQGQKVTNTLAVSWNNDQATDEDVEGIFITDVQSGTSGLALWAGPTDLGSVTIEAGEPANLNITKLVGAID